MPRYIDADALIRKIYPLGIGDGRYVINAGAVKFAIDNTPTADVAPRAELDEAVRKLESLLCHATGGKLSYHTYDLRTMESVVTDYINESYAKGYDEGGAELAREIFEEIAQIKKEYASGDIDGNTLCAMLHLLEKKYTEGAP